MATTKHTVGSTLRAAAYKEDALPENKFGKEMVFIYKQYQNEPQL